MSRHSKYEGNNYIVLSLLVSPSVISSSRSGKFVVFGQGSFLWSKSLISYDNETHKNDHQCNYYYCKLCRLEFVKTVTSHGGCGPPDVCPFLSVRPSDWASVFDGNIFSLISNCRSGYCWIYYVLNNQISSCETFLALTSKFIKAKNWPMTWVEAL